MQPKAPTSIINVDPPSGAFPFDAILLSPEHGVVVFDVVEGTNLGDYRQRQDDFFTKLTAKLIQYPALLE